jgi:peptide/nickel transport system ATP-binding protein
MKRVIEECGGCDDALLDMLGIESAWMNRFPRELSGGELQRFCIARALMSGARYLICDEISTMLDVITQAQIWNVVLAETERRGIGVLAVTHNRNLARRIASRMIEMR